MKVNYVFALQKCARKRSKLFACVTHVSFARSTAHDKQLQAQAMPLFGMYFIYCIYQASEWHYTENLASLWMPMHKSVHFVYTASSTASQSIRTNNIQAPFAAWKPSTPTTSAVSTPQSTNIMKP